MTVSAAEALRARFYVRDILNGLVPSDPLFAPIYVIVGDDDPARMSDKRIARAASLIKELRGAQ